MKKHHRRLKPRPRGVPAAAVPVAALPSEHLAGIDGESLVERIRRVAAVRDERRAAAGHQEVLAAGRARSKRMKGARQ